MSVLCEGAIAKTNIKPIVLILFFVITEYKSRILGFWQQRNDKQHLHYYGNRKFNFRKQEMTWA
jgi:hypothetical protein